MSVLDRRVFSEEWAVMEERFGKAYSPQVAGRYFAYLRDRLTDEAFRAAAHWLFVHSEFFPKPSDFVEAARGGTAIRALEQWDRVHDAMRGLPADDLDPLARKAVSLMGGMSDLGQRDRGDLKWTREEFVRLYGHAEEIRERERAELPAWTEDGRRAFRSLMSGEGES